MEFKKPRTLSCCVCGRDFGLTSLQIHYPKCIQKFQNQQNLKPKAQRKETPSFSIQMLQMIQNKTINDWQLDQIQAFNVRAQQIFNQKAMIKCQNCKRTFLPDSYKKHQKNCILINGNKNGNTPNMMKKGSKQNSSMNKMSPSPISPSVLPEIRKPKVLVCHICGRQFGLTSLQIHQKKCQEKFLNQQSKKESSKRKKLPKMQNLDKQYFNLKQTETWSLQKIEEYNAMALGVYRNQAMAECPICNRKFFDQALQKHIKFCVNNNMGKKPQKVQQYLKKQKGTGNLGYGKQSIKKPKVLMCHICGRQFGLTSLIIHQKKCKQKFLNQQMKKPKAERKRIPVMPDDLPQHLQNLQQASQWSEQIIEQYNRIANQVYRQQGLYECRLCHRKFFEDALKRHLNFCQKQQQRKNERQELIEAKARKTQGDFSKFPNKSNNKSNKNLQMNNLSTIQENNSGYEQNNLTNNKDSRQFSIKKIKKSQSPYLKISKAVPNKQQNEVEQNENMNESQVKLVDELSQTNKKLRFAPIENSQKKQQDNYDAISQKSQNLQDTFKQKKINFEADQDENQFCNAQQNLEISLKNKPAKEQDEKQESKGYKTERSQRSEPQLGKITKKQISQEKSKNIQSKLNNLKNQDQKLQKINQSNTLQNKNQIKSSKQVEEKQKNNKSLKKINEKTEQHQIQSKSKKEESEKKVQSNIKKIQKQNKLTPLLKQKQKKVQITSQSQKLPAMKQLLVPCKGCNRKFAQDRIQKHQSVCKMAKNMDSNSQPNQNLQSNQKKVQEQLKINNINVKPKQSQALNTNSKGQPTLKGLKKNLSSVQQDLVQCQKCSRKFNSDRIQKHTAVCKGTNKNNDPRQSIKKGKVIKQQQQRSSINKFQQLLQRELQKQKVAQSQKSLKKQEQQKKIETNTVSKLGNLQQCQGCKRKYNPQRIQKHKQVCKKYQQIDRQNYFQSQKQFYKNFYAKKLQQDKQSSQAIDIQQSKQQKIDMIKKQKKSTHKKNNDSNYPNDYEQKDKIQAGKVLNMMKDLKGKKKADHQIQNQLENQLKNINSFNINSVQESNKGMANLNLGSISKTKYNLSNNPKSVRNKGNFNLPKI